MKSFRSLSFQLKAGLQPCHQCSNKQHFDLMRKQVGGGVFWVHLRCNCGVEPPPNASALTQPEDGTDEMALAARKAWDRYLLTEQAQVLSDQKGLERVFV